MFCVLGVGVDFCCVFVSRCRALILVIFLYFWLCWLIVVFRLWGLGCLSLVPCTFPGCLLFLVMVCGCFEWLGARTGSASVQAASGHCSGASQVRYTGEILSLDQSGMYHFLYTATVY